MMGIAGGGGSKEPMLSSEGGEVTVCETKLWFGKCDLQAEEDMSLQFNEN
jgi:hypothetical protein